MADLTQQIQYVRDATRRLLAELDGMTDADVRRPSLCTGWTVGHVLTHIARNADGLRRSVEGARRGEVVSMYDSVQSRTADIEAGAARPRAELAADIAATAQALDDSWSGLDAAPWDRDMLHRLGRRPIRQTPAMRWGEVEIHHVDLAGAYRPSDWPPPFVAYLLDHAPASVGDRLPTGVALDLAATDTATGWSFGRADSRRVAVSGPSWAIAAWLLGRSGPVTASLSVVGGELPELAAWG